MSLDALLEQQRRFTDNMTSRDGSFAIAYGRTAGLAKLAGQDDVAQAYWDKIAALPSMLGEQKLPANLPSLDDLKQAFDIQPERFSSFGNTNDFTATGTAFSNALGSYALARDYLRRGDEALHNQQEPGEAQWTAGWAKKALQAANFPSQADMLYRSVLSKAEERRL